MFGDFLKTIHDIIEVISGKRPETPKPKRARGKKGRYKKDDKSTKNYNEAWVGGKAPKRKNGKPSMRWNKKRLINYCNEFGISHDSEDTKKQLLNKIRKK